MANKLVFGGIDPSKIVAEEVGECINFTFHNTLTSALDVTTWDYMGQMAQVQHGGGKIPDVFSVVASPGWEVVTDNFIAVAEGAKGLITVCQMLLG